MKANKTLMATLAIGSLLAFSPALRAADTNAPAATPPPAGAPPAGGQRGRMMGPNIDQVATDLKLTDDQKAKVKTILDDRQTKMRQLMQDIRDQKVDASDRQTKMKAIQDDVDTQLKAVPLTQDQVDQLDKMLRPMGGRRRNAPPAGGDAAPAAPAADTKPQA